LFTPVQHWPAVHPEKADAGRFELVASERASAWVSLPGPPESLVSETNRALAPVKALVTCAVVMPPRVACQLASVVRTTTGTAPARKRTAPRVPAGGVTAGTPVTAPPVRTWNIAGTWPSGVSPPPLAPS
jgi:hypothetical protein